MLRQELIDALTSVNAALGGAKSLVPVHPCFCFTGESVFSYDDTAALFTKLKTPWKGAVRGAVLQSWLSAAGGKDVETDGASQNLKLKCGRAKAEFPVLPPSEFLFSPPDLSKAPKVTLGPGAILALKRTRLAMGTDGQHPWRCGVQALFLEKEVTFFSCDDASAARSWAEVTTPKALRGKAPLLPPRFVDLLLDRSGLEVDLIITDDWYAAQLGDGVTLFSAVPGTGDLTTFQGLFSDAPKNREAAVPLPKTWWGALSRASVLLAGERVSPSSCKIEGGKMSLTTMSSLGHATDTFKLEKEHKDITAKLPPAVVSPVASEVKSFLVTKDPKFCFFGKSFDFVVASGG